MKKNLFFTAAKRFFILCLPVAISFLFSSENQACAAGTAAGATITNQATVEYTAGGVSGLSATSNTVSIRVTEILDVTVSWQDATTVAVMAGDVGQALTFLVTNTGNGADTYSLGVDNTLTGDNFDPVTADLFLDSNGNGIYDPGLDARYEAGVNDPLLAADASMAVFALHDIPAGLSAGDLGDCRLTATSLTSAGAVTGTIIPGAGEGGTDAVVGHTGASADDTGTYEASVITVTKSSTALDPDGGNTVVPGTVLTYTIVVSMSGAGGTATGVIMSDPLPEDTTYIPNSLTVNGTGLTDIADGDAGDAGATNADTITVTLGNLTTGSPDQIITFQVTVD